MANVPNSVFFDVDTQIDFLYPAGALYVPGAERMLGAFARLNRYAAEHGHVVVSTMDAHAEDDVEFGQWPPHCVVGAAEQQKAAATLLEKRVVVPNRPWEANVSGVQQILLEKQTVDFSTNANFLGALKILGAERYVVYGVVTEICVKFAAFGLLRTGARVELVTDAVGSLDDAAATAVIGAFAAQGGVLTTLDAVTSR